MPNLKVDKPKKRLGSMQDISSSYSTTAVERSRSGLMKFAPKSTAEFDDNPKQPFLESYKRKVPGSKCHGG